MDEYLRLLMDQLKPHVYEECRRLNQQYTPPDKAAIERNKDGWEVPAFKLVDVSGRPYFLFTLQSDVQTGDTIVWKGIERWRVTVINRMQDRIYVEAEQEMLRVQVAVPLTPESEVDDLLTVLFRKKVFTRDLSAFIDAALEKRQTLTLLMLDLDKFKGINDTYGHPVGDEVLVACSKVVHERVEGKGKAYRIGGEEIAILLPNFSIVEGEAVAETLRRAIQTCPMSSKNLNITVSIGVASLPEHTQDCQSLLTLADQALYQAKKLGRNLVRVSGEAEDAPASERTIDRRQPDPNGLTPEQEDAIRRIYYTNGCAPCPRDGTTLSILDASSHDSLGELIATCRYCGLQWQIPGRRTH